MFTQVAGSQEISLLGSPVSHELQSLAVEPPVVSGSLIVNFSYPAIQFELPVQVDLWIRFNDQLQISSYDAAFRRWPAAFKYLIPKLLPTIASVSGWELKNSTNTTALISQFAANQICSVSTQYCNGTNQQYES